MDKKIWCHDCGEVVMHKDANEELQQFHCPLTKRDEVHGYVICIKCGRRTLTLFWKEARK